MKFLRFDNPFCSVVNRIFDIVFLSILWTVCSLPIITMGASTSALYYCMLKIRRECDYGIVKMFFHSFRQNFKQGCVLSLICILSGLLLYVDFTVCKSREGVVGAILVELLLILIVLWGMIFSYAFPLLAQFNNKIGSILTNSFFMSFLNLKRTIPVLLLNSVPFIIFFWFPYSFIVGIPFFQAFGVGLMAYINTRGLSIVFDKYIQDE